MWEDDDQPNYPYFKDEEGVHLTASIGPYGGVTGTLGRYEVGPSLGGGSFGTVYRAFDPRTRRDVAIKLMRPDIIELELRSTVQERMRREAQALAALALAERRDG